MTDPPRVGPIAAGQEQRVPGRPSFRSLIQSEFKAVNYRVVQLILDEHPETEFTLVDSIFDDSEERRKVCAWLKQAEDCFNSANLPTRREDKETWREEQIDHAIDTAGFLLLVIAGAINSTTDTPNVQSFAYDVIYRAFRSVGRGSLRFTEDEQEDLFCLARLALDEGEAPVFQRLKEVRRKHFGQDHTN